MVQSAFPEEFDENKRTREENLDEWLDEVEQMEVDEGDVTPSEIMEGDLELSDEFLDDELLNEAGIHIEEVLPDEE
jgi:hypothetical protein